MTYYEFSVFMEQKCIVLYCKNIIKSMVYKTYKKCDIYAKSMDITRYTDEKKI